MTDRLQEPPASLAAAQLIRLLGASVELVADGYDPLASERVFTSAVRQAGTVLLALDGDSAPDLVEKAMGDLSAAVARLPDPWA